MTPVLPSGFAVYCTLVLYFFVYSATPVSGQDGAAYDPQAKNYRASALSLSGAPDTPERLVALAPLWQGDVGKAVPALQALAEHGDVPSALLLASLYRTQSKLPMRPNPIEALRFYKLASAEGSGEGSERVAEMIERHEIEPGLAENAAQWRALAVKQGWREQQLVTFCFDWIHGREALHCDSPPLPPSMAELSPPNMRDRCPNEKEMTLLRKQGYTGAVHVHSVYQVGSGKPWRGRCCLSIMLCLVKRIYGNRMRLQLSTFRLRRIIGVCCHRARPSLTVFSYSRREPEDVALWVSWARLSTDQVRAVLAAHLPTEPGLQTVFPKVSVPSWRQRHATVLAPQCPCLKWVVSGASAFYFGDRQNALQKLSDHE